jgi:feruloyl esterase
MQSGSHLTAVATGAALLGVAVAVPAAQAAGPHSRATVRTLKSHRAAKQSAAFSLNDGTQIAHLKAIPAKESCDELAMTTMAGGQSIFISAHQQGTDGKGGPVYCALTGTINTNIGFEILLPVTTWRQRYLQIGCGGLCGSIGLNAPQTTGYAPLADGDFVVASQDEGHSGQGTSWSTNGAQLVDFAYSSDHQLSEVAKGLAGEFYGLGPKYSYFDGCSQGGHQALTETQRYPKDFNGVLAGAPANIMTELNSIFHEYEYAAAEDASGNPLFSEQEAQLVLNAAMQRCDAQVGLMLDYRECEQKFNINTLACTATDTTNCLTSAQIAAFERVWAGPVNADGQHLFPGGYPLGSEFNWANPTSVNVPATPGGTVIPATFITAWLQYFALEQPYNVASEKYTTPFFKQLEQYAPFWDATNPRLSDFARDGGKLILWQGESDWSIPTSSSIAYYQAVVNANGGLQATKQFARYYLLPSVGHCGGNGPDTYNGLGAVVQWTELHVAPNSLLATQYAPAGGGGGPGGPGGPGGGSSSDLTDAIPVLGAPAATAVVRTLPLYPYPELPAYNGTGNVDNASSFHGKVSHALEQPLPWLGSFNSTTMWCSAQNTNCYLRS